MSQCVGKARYSTPTDALIALVEASLVVQDRYPHHPIRFYPCQLCNGHHLTSKPYDSRRAPLADRIARGAES